MLSVYSLLEFPKRQLSGPQTDTILPFPATPPCNIKIDGRLVLQSSTRGQNYNIRDPLELTSSASMLYKFCALQLHRSHPSDRLLQSQCNLEGKVLVSSVSNIDYSTRKFNLKTQKDENLVQHHVNTANTTQYLYYTSWIDGVVGKFFVHDTCPNSVAGRAKDADNVFSCSLVPSSLLSFWMVSPYFHNLVVIQKGKWD